MIRLAAVLALSVSWGLILSRVGVRFVIEQAPQHFFQETKALLRVGAGIIASPQNEETLGKVRKVTFINLHQNFIKFVLMKKSHHLYALATEEKMR